ncbi:MAG: UDP-glucose/GDP-mannose dehydrogenase family protein [Proteobacteria bacterium]|nr:UDP-glucose/GDP-mannose dehydrogenase family protein [Pseudomonadota bacterium]
MKVSIYGTGYVGLVTGVCLAEVGHRVLCRDIDPAKITQLKLGRIPIYEPGLENLLKKNILENRIQFTTDVKEAVAYAELQIIAVGTPPLADGSADLSFVMEVAQAIAQHMQSSKLLVNKSTVPVGTADRVSAIVAAELAKRQTKIHFSVASNPEFLKEGSAVEDFMKPDRIILGTEQREAEIKLRELYGPFNRNHDRIIIMDIRSAELTKYAANAMLATKISFINEIANLAELLGADIEKVRIGIGSDPRIGYDFIYPGCGYGGSCFPKDVNALIKTAQEVHYTVPLLKAVGEVNQRQKYILFQKINSHFNHNLHGKRFALWGLAFKPNTDDIREASSRVLMEDLWNAGAIVQAFDLKAMGAIQNAYGNRPDLILAANKEDALIGADALIICTEWPAFRAPDFDLIINALKQPIIFDGRNLYDPAQMREKGILYYGVGRGENARNKFNLVNSEPLVTSKISSSSF